MKKLLNKVLGVSIISTAIIGSFSIPMSFIKKIPFWEAIIEISLAAAMAVALMGVIAGAICLGTYLYTKGD